jgi:L-alanine-DL-glutamate epimerase-like enolase superfamily enzyme
MRISDIKITCFKQPMVPIHRLRFTGQQELVLTRIITDSGLEGYSMARAHGGQPGRGIADAIVSTFKAKLLGQDPLDRERHWQKMTDSEPAGYVPVFATSAVDVALWDLAGKIYNTPLYRLLGGRNDKIMAYASSANMERLDDYIADVRRSLERGYKAYKIHPFNDPTRDAVLCQAIRKEVGPNIKLMLDVNKTYDRMSALRMGRLLENLDFTWFEEPLPQYDIEGYAALSQTLDIPVIGAETVPGGPFAIANYLRANALDMVLCDVYWKGGVTGMLRTAHLCEGMGIKVASHHGASPVMNFANLHVLCGATSADLMEMLVPEEGYNFALKSFLKPDKEGYLHPPEGAGLGVELDWDHIRANTTLEM